MNSQRGLVQKAMTAALRTRTGAKRGLSEAICVYDLAADLGVDVRFDARPSLEGIYSRDPKPTIILSCLRPSGRRAYNCAHEIGHHVFGHQFRVDELIDKSVDRSFDSDEFLVNCFASFLLMPKSAVDQSFARRNINSRLCSPLQCFVIAGFLGVGYTTLVQHMQRNLKLISKSRADELRATRPKEIRRRLLGFESAAELFVVDSHWTDRPLDTRSGDFILVPSGCKGEGDSLDFISEDQRGVLLKAAAPGQKGRVYDPSGSWEVSVRVSRMNFTGLSIYRHLEEVDED